MATMFAPGREYDLKNNPNFNASQEFGNWFYGAAAAQLGFTEEQALTAGAVVQQWQNFNSSNHPDAGNTDLLAENILHSLNTGQGDNPDDPPVISGGYSYSSDVYENDPDSATNEDSCNTNSSSSSDGGGTDGQNIGGQGWNGTGAFIGGSCIGSCGFFFSGGFTTITDLPGKKAN